MRGQTARHRMRAAILAALVFLGPAALFGKDKNPQTYRIPQPPKPDFTSVEWMLGSWTGQMDRHSPQGQIHLTVSYDLDKRVMIFREKISLAETGEIPAMDESSLGVLSSAPSGDLFRLQVFSSTGFITQYRVTVSGSEIDFSPDGGSQPMPGWLSRRIIQRGDVDGFTETVQLAPPLKPFFDYYTAAFTRDAPPEKSQAGPSEGKKTP